MGKDRNTFAKHQREMEKREKAAKKREKRIKRQNEPSASNEALPLPQPIAAQS